MGIGYNGPEFVDGNLFRTNGTWKAVFRTAFVNPRYSSSQRVLRSHTEWSHMIALIEQPFEHHVCVRTMPMSAVMERMSAAVPGGDLDSVSQYVEHMQDTADDLEAAGREFVEKFGLLVVTLPVNGRSAVSDELEGFAAVKAGVRSHVQGAAAKASPRRGLPGRAERESARDSAAQLYRRLSTVQRDIRPASVGDVQWWAAFGVSFGGVDPAYTAAEFREDLVVTPTPTVLADADINRGRVPRKTVKITGPVVEDEFWSGDAGDQTVFQTFLVLRAAPRSWEYPHGALTEWLDRLPFPYRLSVFSRPIANSRVRASLDGQFKVVEGLRGESEGAAAPYPPLEVARQELEDELAVLSSSSESAVPSTIVVSLAAGSSAGLEDRVRAFKALMKASGNEFSRPVGSQTRLWASMMPGGPQPPVGYERELLCADWASLATYHGRLLGTDRGILLGWVGHSGSGPFYPVFFDPAFGPTATDDHAGATIALAGGMGSGKTYLMKRCAIGELWLGGRIFVLDRTPQADREWVRAVAAVRGKQVRVVRSSDARVNLDPLENFTAHLPEDPEVRGQLRAAAETHTIGFLAIRLSISAEDAVYEVLSRAVALLLQEGSPTKPTMANLLRAVRVMAGEKVRLGDARFKAFTGAMSDAAARLVLKLESLESSSSMGGSLFGGAAEKRQPLDLTADAIVFSEPGLDLSSVHGRSLMYLVTAYSLAFMGAVPQSFSLVCLPELSDVVSDTYGRKLLDNLLRLSRRLRSGVIADSQRAVDYTNEDILALFATRFAFRTHDEDGLAGCEFAGMTPSSYNATRLAELPGRFAVMHDPARRTDYVEFLPASGYLHEFFRTDPDRLGPDELDELLERQKEASDA